MSNRTNGWDEHWSDFQQLLDFGPVSPETAAREGLAHLQPYETAPRTGEHFLAIDYSYPSWGTIAGKPQFPACVVHYWDNPGEEGFYPSLGPDETFKFTHWLGLA